jgi:hypothetical protein
MTSRRRLSCAGGLGLLLCMLASGCSTYEIRHEIQWDSREQIWLSDASQVQLRAIQSRVFEGSDRTRTLEAVVATFQDLGFQVEVLDEELGIVSGKRFEDRERHERFYDPLYHLYDDEALLVFSKTYRTWGPFWHRSDLVRLTVTVRQRSEAQLVVRASAQHYLQPVEAPEPYQKFFETLTKAMFVEQQLLY